MNIDSEMTKVSVTDNTRVPKHLGISQEPGTMDGDLQIIGHTPHVIDVIRKVTFNIVFK